MVTNKWIGAAAIFAMISALALFCHDSLAQATGGIITTVAGDGTEGTSGNGGPATSAQLSFPDHLAIDADGNLFISETGSRYHVRRIDTNGVITTVAGARGFGFSGDGGLAVDAQLSRPIGVAVNADGILFIADANNHRIRRVDARGTIITIAGNGTSTISGDGGAATLAGINFPGSIALDADGNLFISHEFNNLVRRIDTSGIITTVAGIGRVTGGFSGDGGPAVVARLNTPTGVAVDVNGNLFIADRSNFRIRRVGTDGIITTVAGTGTRGSSGDGGPAGNAQLTDPVSLAVDLYGSLFIADRNGQRIRRIDTNGVITTVAGTGAIGFSGDGGPAVDAQLGSPTGVAVDANGNLLIADQGNHRIRRVSQRCGNGERFPQEACDDGNAADGDGCSSLCQVETGFSCTGSPRSLCTSTCGDRILASNEECDDGNTADGDGCGSTCIIEIQAPPVAPTTAPSPTPPAPTPPPVAPTTDPPPTPPAPGDGGGGCSLMPSYAHMRPSNVRMHLANTLRHPWGLSESFN